jgi:predicted secreted protein
MQWLLFFSLMGILCAPAIANAADTVVTAADKGGHIALKLDASFELHLPSNPTTGYMWYVEKESTPGVKLVKQWQIDSTEPGVGRPIVQVFKFEGKHRGTGVLRMHYVRSWEPPAPDDEKFDLTVTVE